MKTSEEYARLAEETKMSQPNLAQVWATLAVAAAIRETSVEYATRKQTRRPFSENT